MGLLNKTFIFGALLLALGIGTGCQTAPKKAAPEPAAINKQEQTTWQRYGRNIKYINLGDIDFAALPKDNIPLPSDLEKWLYRPKVADKGKLEQLILAEAEKIGYSRERLKSLSAEEAIEATLAVLASRLSYLDVDDEEFVKQHGRYLPLEDYFELGKADCNRYTDAFIAVFSTIKSMNPNLSNIYASNHNLGGNWRLHDWNAIIILANSQLIISHIDPTKHINKTGPLEVTRGHYLSADDLGIIASFYAELLEHSASYQLYSESLEKTTAPEEKAEILFRMACLAGAHLGDKQKMDYVRKEYMALGIDKWADNILYYSFRAEQANGNHNAARRFKQLLKDNFPESGCLRYAEMAE